MAPLYALGFRSSKLPILYLKRRRRFALRRARGRSKLPILYLKLEIAPLYALGFRSSKLPILYLKQHSIYAI